MSVELISSDDNEWTSIFDEVLFPLVLLLLKPEVYQSDPVGMSETRFQAATLVCKIFLRFLDQLPNRTGMLPLWLGILDVLDRMMNSGQGDSLVSQPTLHGSQLSSKNSPLTSLNLVDRGCFRNPEEYPSSNG